MNFTTHSAESIVTLLQKDKELILVVRASDVETIKARLSQAKHRMRVQERLSMTVPSTAQIIDGHSVVDLHCRLGAGLEIDVFEIRPVDTEL